MADYRTLDVIRYCILHRVSNSVGVPETCKKSHLHMFYIIKQQVHYSSHRQQSLLGWCCALLLFISVGKTYSLPYYLFYKPRIVLAVSMCICLST